jgi:hypothetical protein
MRERTFGWISFQRLFQLYSRLLVLVEKCHSISLKWIRFLYNANFQHVMGRAILNLVKVDILDGGPLVVSILKEDINCIAVLWP